MDYEQPCSPVRTTLGIEDCSGNLMIEFKRQQMELSQRNLEVQALKKRLDSPQYAPDTKDALIATLKSEVERLEAHNHHLKTIMSMERLDDQFTIGHEESSSASSGLPSDSSVIRHYIKNDVSTVNVQRVSIETRNSVLPARWTRSMQNLKQDNNPKQPVRDLRKSASCSKMSMGDTIDQLESQVSQLQFLESFTDIPTASPLKGHRSLFKEDFSAERTEEMSSRRWSNPDALLDEFAFELKPKAESTFILTEQQPTDEEAPAAIERQAENPVKQRPQSQLTVQLVPRAPENIMQLVTQVFVGEFMDKQVSGLRGRYTHKRYFWVHPYTMSLYWAKQMPSSPSQGWHKAKSIRVVRVTEQSGQAGTRQLVMHGTRRTVCITCADFTRHTVWQRALNYLLEAQSS